MGTMKKHLAVITALLLFFGGPVSRAEDDTASSEIDARGSARLALAIGNADPGLCHRLAGELSPAQLKNAFYKGSRVARLVALDVAGYTAATWDTLPYLAALMGARDRQVASRAAGSFTRLLADAAHAAPTFSEVVSGQVERVAGQLASIARDVRLDADVRGAAVAGLFRLSLMGHEIPSNLTELLDDADPAVRRSALALLRLPLDEGNLQKLARLTVDGDDIRLRGQGAALLCENALAHGAKAPSRDLLALLKSVIGDSEMPAGAIGAVLACLKHFRPADRVDLIELARAHPDRSIQDFWKALLKDEGK
jgi:hypothetical protein